MKEHSEEYSVDNDSANSSAPRLVASQPGGMFAQFAGEEFSLSRTIGGVRGVLEATLPTILVIGIYPFTKSLFWPLVAALAATIVFAVWRLAQKSSLKQVLAGLLGTAIGAFWAWKTGQATNFFALGFWINGVYASVLTLTLLVKRPVVGWLVAAATGRLEQWRTALGGTFYRRSFYSTLAWIALFLIRLTVELPLFYANQLVGLGIARLVLGLPAFAFVGWLNWAWLSQCTQALRELPTDESAQ